MRFVPHLFVFVDKTNCIVYNKYSVAGSIARCIDHFRSSGLRCGIVFYNYIKTARCPIGLRADNRASMAAPNRLRQLGRASHALSYLKKLHFFAVRTFNKRNCCRNGRLGRKLHFLRLHLNLGTVFKCSGKCRL